MATKETIGDFGKKIGGARKDIAGNFRRDDVIGLTHIERKKLVKKDKVWPTPDFVDLVATKGYSREAAMAVKMLRDSFPAAPVVLSSVSEESYARACELYVEGINAVKAAAEAGSTFQAIANALRTNPDMAEKIGIITQGTGYKAVSASPSFLKWCSGPDMYMSSSEKWAITGAIGYAANKEFNYTASQLLENNPIWPNGTSQAEAYVRRENLSIAKVQGSEQWAIARHGRVIAERDYDYYKRHAKFGAIVSNRFESKEAGEKALIEAVEAGYATKRQASKEKRDTLLGIAPKNAAVEPTYRKGEDYRKGIDATGDDYLKIFGMIGGEFGNWVEQDKRQELLNNGFDAYVDMARVLGMELDQLSFGGRTAIAFGARGNGGVKAAAAHYEPGRKVTNLTKPRGEGVLAHEHAGHAFDHYLGDALHELGLPIDPRADGVRYLSCSSVKEADLAKLTPEARAQAEKILQVKKAMTPIWEKDRVIPREEEILKSTQRRDRAMKILNDEIDNIVKHRLGMSLHYGGHAEDKIPGMLSKIEEILKSLATPEALMELDTLMDAKMAEIRKIMGPRGSVAYIKSAIKPSADSAHYALHNLKEYNSPDFKPRIVKESTEYAKTCRKLDQELNYTEGYISTPVEMFALSVEAIIDDEIRGNGLRSPFLQRSTHNPLHPQGQEREAIRASLLPALREVAKTIPRTNPDLKKNRFETASAGATPLDIPVADEPASVESVSNELSPAPTETPISLPPPPSIEELEAELTKPAVHKPIKVGVQMSLL